MRLSVVSAWFIAAAVLVSVNAERNERQLFSSSRFSSSGLVFPGPPAQQPGQGQQVRPRIQQRPVEDQLAVEKSDLPSGNFNGRPQQPQQQRFQAGPNNFRPSAPAGPRPPFAPGSQPGQPKPNPERNLPPVPLSLIGQQPEEFIAAAQQRQQQQQQQQQARPQSPQSSRTQPPAEEEEEPLLSSAEIQEEFVPRAPARPQPKENPEKPIRIRRPQEDQQRPEPSIQQPVQQRRPNYPSDYKPSRPQQNNGLEEERRRPPSNQPAETEEELLEEEEEEVKPDKLQLLLQKTDFSCAEKKDGYYADEAVECEIFHYCQDRTRHSWLCPAGASFHQVHLICMPVTKDNICKKSSQFHFVNEYLYQPMQDEDGNNSTLYADRYYPEGYEPGVPFDMGDVAQPEKPNLQYNNRRQAAAPVKRIQQQRYTPENRPVQNRERVPNESRRQPVDQRRPFQAPSAEETESQFNKQTPFRGEDSPNRRMASRPQVQPEASEEEEQ